MENTINDLKKQIEFSSKKVKYGIRWESWKVEEDLIKNFENKVPIIEEIKNLKIFKNDNNNNNILINGDNFYALNVLNFTHKEKVDLIYYKQQNVFYVLEKPKNF